MRKRGRPALGNKKAKLTAFSLSTLAYANLLKIPAGERSLRISKFLERMDPGLDVRTPGIRLAPVVEQPEENQNLTLTTDLEIPLPKLTEVSERREYEDE